MRKQENFQINFEDLLTSMFTTDVNLRYGLIKVTLSIIPNELLQISDSEESAFHLFLIYVIVRRADHFF